MKRAGARALDRPDGAPSGRCQRPSYRVTPRQPRLACNLQKGGAMPCAQGPRNLTYLQNSGGSVSPQILVIHTHLKSPGPPFPTNGACPEKQSPRIP